MKESSAPIGDGGYAGLYRHASQIALDVLRELLDGSISALGFLAQRLHYYGVEIATQTALQLSRLQAALLAYRLRSNVSSHPAIGRYLFSPLVNGGARFFEVSFANQPLHFQKRLASRVIRSMAGQQFEEQYPQGIDIGCGRDRVPTNLFWARILRGHRAPVSSSDKCSLEDLG